jgi:hypothetical protein
VRKKAILIERLRGLARLTVVPLHHARPAHRHLAEALLGQDRAIQVEDRTSVPGSGRPTVKTDLSRASSTRVMDTVEAVSVSE